MKLWICAAGAALTAAMSPIAAHAQDVAIVSPPSNSATITVPNGNSRDVYVNDHDPGPDVVATAHVCNQSSSTSVNVISNDDNGAGIVILAPSNCGVVSGRKVTVANPSTPAEDATVVVTILAIMIDGVAAG